jgi:hypothetical protein
VNIVEAIMNVLCHTKAEIENLIDEVQTKALSQLKTTNNEIVKGSNLDLLVRAHDALAAMFVAIYGDDRNIR